MTNETDDPNTLADLFAIYRVKRLRGASLKTIQQHEVAQRRFEKFLARRAYVRDLTDETLADFAAWWLDQGAKAVTINKSIGKLLAVWRFAAQRGLYRTWPTLQKLPEPRRIPKAWTLEQVRSLLSACRRLRGGICGVPESAWWLTLHLVALDTAERIGALLRVEWEWLDLRRSTLTIPAEARKGGLDPAVYKLHPETIAELEKIRNPRRRFVWPWPLNPSMVYYRYRKILKSAGLPIARECMFHCLRRTVASHVKVMGGDVTGVLRHRTPASDPSYLDPTITGLPTACDILPRLDLATID